LKNKYKTYLLLVAVLGIWGTIGYKLLNGLSSDETEITNQNFDVAFNPKEQKAIDTFSIQEVQRDPFLGTLSSTKKAKVSNSRSNVTKKASIKQRKIIYEGLVKKQNSSDQVFVITIENEQYLLKKGQIADSVKLVRGNSKEIIILHRNKRQTIKRQ